MKLSPAQFATLHTLFEFGPKTAMEVLAPADMSGKRKAKLEWNVASAPTLASLEAAGLVSVERRPVDAPSNAFGKLGHPRRALTIAITDKGRLAIKVG